MSSANWLYWTPVILWAIVMLFVSAMPGEAIEGVDVGSGKISNYSLIWHFGEFLVFSFLLFRAMGAGNDYGRRKLAAVVLGVSFFYAFVTEIVQIYVPGRFFDYYDIAVNNLGAFAGLSGMMHRSRMKNG